jgi:hypothetical protein
MNDQPQPRVPLEIRSPCPKSWAELEGDGAKRFCSACALHVHDAAQLTRAEAQALAAETSTRVCMRIRYDPHGAPIFRDSPRARPAARLARWVLSTAAGVLAACHGSLSGAPPDAPATAGGVETPSRMGKVVAPEMLGEVAPVVPEQMGGLAPEPATEPVPDTE